MTKCSVYRDGKVIRVFRFVDENEKPLSISYLIDQIKRLEKLERYEDCALIRDEIKRRKE